MEDLTKKLIYAIYIVLVCVLFASCNHLEKGEVIGKHYEPTTQTMMMLPMVISNGKTTTTVMMPYFVTDYEDYVLHVKGIHKGKEVTEEVYVTKDCWNSFQNGDTWYKDDNCSFSDDNNTRDRID